MSYILVTFILISTMILAIILFSYFTENSTDYWGEYKKPFLINSNVEFINISRIDIPNELNDDKEEMLLSYFRKCKLKKHLFYSNKLQDIGDLEIKIINHNTNWSISICQNEDNVYFIFTGKNPYSRIDSIFILTDTYENYKKSLPFLIR